MELDSNDIWQFRDKKIDEYYYKVSAEILNGTKPSSPLAAQQEGEVVITFINGKFDSVKYPFKNHPYTRKQWACLGAINDIINTLEKKYADRL